jgi:hypothetical protein
MMRKIIGNSIGHSVSDKKFPQSSYFMCTLCASGKLILRPSHLKIQGNHSSSLNAFKGIYVDPSSLYLDRSDISWF